MGAGSALRAYAQKLRDAAPLIEERLAEIGADRASSDFANAAYAGTNDVTVSTDRTDEGMAVVASGEAVAFIEFGTGITMEPYPGELPPDISPRGAYGQGKGSNPKGWIYAGEEGTGGLAVPAKRRRKDGSEVEIEGVWRTWGNPPAAGLYHAGEEIMEHCAEAVREVMHR